MLKLFKPKQEAILGIDISSTAVKILEISSRSNQYKVDGYGTIKLPENAMEGVSIKDVEQVASCIRRLFSSTRFNCKQAAVAVPDSSTISKIIQMNEGLNDDELEELVIMEADKYIPYPIDEINIDFSVLGPAAKNAAMLDVLVVASRAENVSSRVEAVNRAGLEARIVDIESYAIERMSQLLIPQLPKDSENQIIALIDFGYTYTVFYVLQGMKIIFSREEEFGGKQLVDTIVQVYGLKHDAAVAAIDEGRLPDNYIDEVLYPFQELIILQVKRGLQFFFSSSQHTHVDHIILGGGLAKQVGIAELLNEHINIPTQIANPFANMAISDYVNRENLTDDAPSLLVACGLALRNAKSVR